MTVPSTINLWLPRQRSSGKPHWSRRTGSVCESASRSRGLVSRCVVAAGGRVGDGNGYRISILGVECRGGIGGAVLVAPLLTSLHLDRQKILVTLVIIHPSQQGNGNQSANQ